MGTGQYILRGTTPVLVEDLLEWGRWYETAGEKRVVARTQVGRYRISTVFLGLDHGFSRTGPPILFETMIFDEARESGSCDLRRYSTWAEAEQGHQEWTDRLRRLGPWWP